MIIIDTVNLIDTERGLTLKQSIDKLSEYCAKYLRNRYHYSPIVIQQQAFESEGNDAFKLAFTADYSLSRLLTMSLYYDRQSNTPLLSASSYPTVTQDFGLSMKFSLTR
jgi:cell surface protein SprA